MKTIWVFGMVDTSKTPALGHMEIVPDRTRTTLLPIIQANTLPNTIIHSDDYSIYRTVVGRLPNVAQHRIVNYSLHFVDPVTGVHTQHIESYWNRVKLKFKRMRGVGSDQFLRILTNSCGGYSDLCFAFNRLDGRSKEEI